MSEQREEQCGRCRFYKSYHVDDINPDDPDDCDAGDCHRYPPWWMDEYNCTWPVVLERNWCGEFQPKPPEPA